MPNTRQHFGRLADLVAVAVTFVVLTGAGVARAVDDAFDYEPINYHSAKTRDPVTLLQQRLDNGETTLAWDDTWGYLPAVLKELKISTASQTLVFSKTSFQLRRISPETPRTVYFGDHAYVGWVQHGSIEVTSIDPQLGGIFYTFDNTQRAEGDVPRFKRNNNDCLSCHSSSRTQSVPGHMVRSIYPDSRGFPIVNGGGFATTDRSPLRERWGGWYVSGTHGDMVHLGNRTYDESLNFDMLDKAVDLSKTGNVTDLSRFFDTSKYLTPYSDIVALLVMEHQTHTQNLITRANYRTRIAIHSQNELAEATGQKIEGLAESTKRRIEHAGEPLVRALLMCEEARLTSTVKGVSGFTEKFIASGKRDHQGRSLRDLDLQTRLFKYPCSYLVYSDEFRALPAEMKAYVYRRIWEVVTQTDTSMDFAHLSATDLRNIREILTDTIRDLPDYWYKAVEGE
ncbi:MAG: hypothetical protein GC159_21665 [Phycisphaera sp.]|nr:hypothetical protein [Phycisphaera sp.]